MYAYTDFSNLILNNYLFLRNLPIFLTFLTLSKGLNSGILIKTLHMGDGLTNVVDGNDGSNDVNPSDIKISSNTNIMLATFVSIMNEQIPVVKALPIASSSSPDDINGLNLGIQIIKNEFEGFTGIAKITSPYVRFERPTGDNGQKYFLNSQKIPRTYLGADSVSRENMSKILPKDVVGLTHYRFNPNKAKGLNHLHNNLENDLLHLNFCDKERLPYLTETVLDAIRTYKIPKVESRELMNFYILFVDHPPKNKNNYFNGNVSDSNTKSIYVLRCWTHDSSHLNS